MRAISICAPNRRPTVLLTPNRRQSVYRALTSSVGPTTNAHFPIPSCISVRLRNDATHRSSQSRRATRGLVRRRPQEMCTTGATHIFQLTDSWQFRRSRYPSLGSGPSESFAPTLAPVQCRDTALATTSISGQSRLAQSRARQILREIAEGRSSPTSSRRPGPEPRTARVPLLLP